MYNIVEYILNSKSWFSFLSDIESGEPNLLPASDPNVVKQLYKARGLPNVNELSRYHNQVLKAIVKNKKRLFKRKRAHLESIKSSTEKTSDKVVKVNRKCFHKKRECIVSYYRRKALDIDSFNSEALYELQKPVLLKAINPQEPEFSDLNTICAHNDGFIFPAHPIAQSYELVAEVNENLFMNPSGLHNFGITCYMNSVLQCLFAIPIFVNYLVNSFGAYCICHKDPSKPNSHCYICDLRSLVLHKCHHNIGVDPTSLFNNLPNLSSVFNSDDMQDSSEFFGCLIEKLSQICTLNHLYSFGQHSFKSYLSDPISMMFDIHNERRRHCCKCKGIETSFLTEKYIIFSSEKHSNLHSALNNKFNESELEEVYTCNLCMSKGTISVTNKLRHLPPIFVVSVNRTSMESFEEKVSTDFQAPRELNLRPYVSSACQDADSDEDCTYELRGFISHHGYNPFDGHYFADVKSCYNDSSDTWFTCNDKQVFTNTVKDKQINQASMLFYTKVTKFSSLSKPSNGATYYIPYTFERDQ